MLPNLYGLPAQLAAQSNLGFCVVMGRLLRQLSTKMASRLLTIDAVAAMLDVSPRTVQREIDAGAISTVRVRRLVRIDAAEAQAYIARQTTRKKQPCPSTSAVTAGIIDFRQAARDTREALALALERLRR